MADLRDMTLSEDYADYIIAYTNVGQQLPLPPNDEYNYQPIDQQYAVLHINNIKTPVDTLTQLHYGSIPKLFVLNSTVSLEKSGIIQAQTTPTLNLDGRGIMLGFVDTGINYTHPAFLDSQNNSRIQCIWDQTIQSGTTPENFVYGSEYTNEDINRALASENPYSIVPSTDTNGHGTLIAGIAAGTANSSENFIGAAPASYIAVVKLKEAKNYLKDYFRVSPNVPVYQESDIIFGLRYLLQKSTELNLPLIICIALGTNQGSHNGNNPLDRIIMNLRSYQSLTIVTSGGNEAGKAHHYYGEIPVGVTSQEVEIQVEADTGGFNVELWGQPPETFSIGVVSPLGEVVERIPARLGQRQSINFILDNTTMDVQYETVDPATGEQLILLRFRAPSPGIWRVRVFSDNYINGRFHMWLPVTGMVTPDVIFLSPNPYTTITNPGNSTGTITPAAYNAFTNALYQNSGRGYTPNGIIKPDIAAPGVNLTAPDLHDGYITATGSGCSAALTAGSCALVMQWGLARTPQRSYYTNEIRTFLIRGATRTSTQVYPNREWGYGTLNVYHIFTTFLSP